MAEPLEIDLRYVPDLTAALAALAQVDDAVQTLARDLATAGEALTGAGAGLAQLSDAAAGLDAAADAAGTLAEGLGDASGAAGDLAGAADAEALAGGLESAADAAGTVSTGLDDAADAAGRLAEGLGDAETAARRTSEGVDAVDPAPIDRVADALREGGFEADRLAAAVERIRPLVDALPVGQLDEFADRVRGQVEGIIAAEERAAVRGALLGGLTAETGTDRAGQVRDYTEALDGLRGGIVELTAAAGGIDGPLGKLVSRLGDVARAATVGDIVAAGLIAGEAALIAYGEDYDNLIQKVVDQTTLAGDALAQFQGDVGDILRNVDDDLGIVGDTAITLSRDLGASGEALVGLASRTTDFLGAFSGGAADVRALTQVVNQFGLGLDETARLQDVLIATQQRYGTSVGQILSQVRTAGPALTSLGFDPQQIAVLIGQFDQAGVGLARLSPGLTKLSNEARKAGKDASQAFTDLVDSVAGAATQQEALGRATTVFGARIAGQFVGAVRSGVVSIKELQTVLDGSVGAVDRVGAAEGRLGVVLGELRNQAQATLGPIGRDLRDQLADGLERTKPLLAAVLELLAAVSPAFGTFGRLVGVAAELSRPLVPVLETLAKVIDAIPDPLLEVAGAFAVFNKTPFGKIASTVEGVGSAALKFGKQLPGLSAGAGSAGGALSGLGAGAGVASAGIGLLAAGGLFAVNRAMKEAAEQAKDIADKVDGLNQALGTTAAAADSAAVALDKAFSDTGKTQLIDPEDRENLVRFGVSIQDIRRDFQEGLDPHDSVRRLREQVLEAAGGIGELARQFAPVGSISRQNAEDLLKTADGAAQLKEQFLDSGTVAGAYVDQLGDLEGTLTNLAKAEQRRADDQLNQLLAQGKVTAATVAQSVAALGLTEVKGHESAVLAEVQRRMGAEAAARAGLVNVTEEQAAAALSLRDALEQQGATSQQVADKEAAATRLRHELADESFRNGQRQIDTDAQIRAAVRAGVTDTDAATAAVADYNQALNQVTGPADRFADINEKLARSIASGVPPQEALNRAVLGSNHTFDETRIQYDHIRDVLAQYNPDLERQADLQVVVSRAMADGHLAAEDFGDVLAATGGDIAEADRQLAAFKTSVEKSTAAIRTALPEIGAAVDQINQTTAQPGREAEAAKERADAVDLQLRRERDATEALAALRDQDLASQQAQVAAAIELGRRQAEAQGVRFDETALQAQLSGLQNQRDQVAAQLGETTARIDEAGGVMNDALARAGSGPLGLEGTLTSFEQDLETQLATAELVLQLRADGLAATVAQVLGNSKLSDDAKTAALQELAHASPEEKAALEQHSKELAAKADEVNEGLSAVGDLFADKNQLAIDHATDRGADLADGISAGLASGLTDAEIPELVKALVNAGTDPDAAKAALDRTTDVLRRRAAEKAVGIGADLAAGALKGLDANPLPGSAADDLVASVASQMGVAGGEAGTNYAEGVEVSISTNPVPASAGLALVSTVSQALAVAGTSAGANYALSIAAGIASKQGDMISAAFLAAQAVDEAGRAALEVASPSRKGRRVGEFWAEGVAEGLKAGVATVSAGARQVAEAVDVKLTVPPSARQFAPAVVAAPVLAGVGATTGGAGQVAAGPTVHIENLNVPTTTNATAPEVVTEIGHRIAWAAGLTGRNER